MTSISGYRACDNDRTVVEIGINEADRRTRIRRLDRQRSTIEAWTRRQDNGAVHHDRVARARHRAGSATRPVCRIVPIAVIAGAGPGQCRHQ